MERAPHFFLSICMYRAFIDHPHLEYANIGIAPFVSGVSQALENVKQFELKFVRVLHHVSYVFHPAT